MRIDRIKIISEMARQNIKVNDLAKKANICKSTVSGVRNGKSCTDVVGKAIAQALGVDVTELLEI